MIEELYVIYRPIGCEDEASTDEEQGEKILFSYPLHQSLEQQLSRVTMLEGLIDFTSRFSEEDIHTVVMEKRTWAFMQPEEGLWFIASAPLDSIHYDVSKKPTGARFNTHKPSGTGMIDGMNRMYKVFVMLRGGVTDTINHRKSMDAIENIQSRRKRVRKLRRRMLQEQLDYENIRQDRERSPSEENAEEGQERVGVRNDENVSLEALMDKINESMAEIQALEKELAALVSAPTYVLTALRERMRCFIMWFLDTKELHNGCGLQSLGGMHYCTVGHPAFQSLTLVRQAVDDITRGKCRGCLILYDGQVVWSDLGDDTTYALYDFVRMQENAKLRDIITEYERRKQCQMKAAYATKKGRSRSRSRSSTGGIGRHNVVDAASANTPPLPPSQQEEEAGLPEDWLQMQMDANGFIVGDWGTVDAEGLQPHYDNNHNHISPLADPDYACLPALEGMTGPHNLFFPSIFLRTTADGEESEGGNGDSDGDGDNKSGNSKYQPNIYDEQDFDDAWETGPLVQLGRLLFYRQACFIVCMVVPAAEAEATATTSPEKAGAAEVAGVAGAAGADDEISALPSFTSSSSSSSSKKSVTRGGSITNFNSLLPQEDGASRIRNDSASSFVSGNDNYDDNDDDDREGDNGSGELKPKASTSLNFTTKADVTHVCGMLQRGLCDALDQLLVSMGRTHKHLDIYGLQWQGGKLSPGLGKAGESSGGAHVSVQAATTTVTRRASMDSSAQPPDVSELGGPSGGGGGGGETVMSSKIHVDPSLIVAIPSRPVVQQSGLPTGTSAYYYNAANRAAKAPGLYTRSVDPLLHWPQPIVCMARSGGPIEQVSATKAMSEVLSDDYLSNLLSLFRHRFPIPSSLLVSTLSPDLVQAFNDLRENLSSRYNRTESVCTELCMRISSAQHGGVWVLGRKSDSRYLFLAIEGCATLQEAMSKVRRTTDGVFKRVVI